MAELVARNALVVAANRIGANLLPDNAQWTNRVEIKSSSSSRLYIVAQHKTNGSFGCSCPGWKAHRHCKHLDLMVPLLISAPRQNPNLRGR